MSNGADPALVAVFVVAGVFLVWYFVGGVYNRRRARRVANELKDALLGLGGTSRVQWFGMTAFRMTTEGANPPFRDLSFFVTMRPREMPINWAIGLASGRTDLATVEASLRSPPVGEFELLDPQMAVARRRARVRQTWSSVSLAGRDWLLWAEDERKARGALEGLDRELAAVGALKVTPGDVPRISGAFALRPETEDSVVPALRRLAERVSSQ